jgi:fibronectin-binding autotransporter adhesin
MPGNPHRRSARSLGIKVTILLLLAPAVLHADLSTWSGGGTNSFWSTSGNWDLPPIIQNTLVFTGSTRLVNTNDLASGTMYWGIRFDPAAGPFTLWGNPVIMNTGITDAVAGVAETIQLPMILGNDIGVDVSSNATLAFGGEISSGYGQNYGFSKTGPGTLALNASNSFSGDFTVFEGTLVAGNNSALGATNGGAASIAAGATLEVNGRILRAKPLTAGGDGVNGAGAIVNNGPDQTSAFSVITLTANTTFGGTHRWDMRAVAGALLTSPPGSPFNLTKVGPNEIALVNVTNIDPMLADLDIQQGTFGIQTSTTQFGNPTNTITVRSNAVLNVWNLTAGPLNKEIVMQNANFWAESGTSTNIGPISLTGSNIFSGGGTLWISSNAITGPGSLAKTGSGNLVVTKSPTYTGDTLLLSGTLTLVGDAELTNSPRITVLNFSTLDLHGSSSGGLRLYTGRLFGGKGQLNGNLTADAGSTVSVATRSNADSIPTLSVSGTLILRGQLIMPIDASAWNSSQLGAGTISAGGTLIVTNTSGIPFVGENFFLFSGGLASHFDAINLPPLPPGLAWTNRLSIDGSIAVIASSSLPLRSAAINHQDFRLTTATNGRAGASFSVYASTDVTLPLTNWTLLTNGLLDGSGNCSLVLSNALISQPRQFYLLFTP